MVQSFAIRRLFFLMSTVGLISLTNNSFGAAFQLFEQDAASIGNYHAGRAAIAEDASTAYYNPAGLIRFKNQQIILGADPIVTDFKFRGTVDVLTNSFGTFSLLDGPQPVSEQGGGFNLIPFFHYVSPVNDCLSYGMSVVVPFGLKTDYGYDSIVRYVATRTSIRVIDVSPALGWAITQKLSVGAGLNIQFIDGEFNEVARGLGVDASDSSQDTVSLNKGHGHAFGYHLGVLYQLTPCTRIGVSYQSQVVHHLRGRSRFEGFLANGVTGGAQVNNSLRTTTTLPPITSLSLFHSFNPCWDVMGTVSYTQWKVFKHLILNNVAGLNGTTLEPINDLQIFVQENYHNAWNYALGANFHPCDQWILRTGIGYDQSPTSDRFRNVQLPDSDRIAVAFGAHYQLTPCLGFDAGYTHLFVMNTRINNIQQVVGDETIISNGSVHSGADVYGLQVKWDIA